MKLIELSIKRPISVIVCVLFIALFGLISLFRIPVQLTPNVDRPIIEIETNWSGASPEEIEQEIVQRQEEQLKSLDGLLKMTSESQDSRGKIKLEFSIDSQIDGALIKVSNKLNMVKGYPPESDKPTISSGGNNNTGAITWLILDTLPNSEPKDLELYRPVAENIIKTEIERVKGVSISNVFGGYERQLNIIFDPQTIATHQITINQLIETVTHENANISAGSFDEGKRRYIVRTVGKFQNPKDVENLIIRKQSNQQIKLGDIARVELGYKRADGSVRQKGQPAIAINAIRETGSNVLEVMEDIRNSIDRLNEGPLKRQGLFLRQVYDETDYINSAINLVRSNIVIGGFLATVVLLLFLRSGSSVAIIVIAIPISIFGTFVSMSLLGRNINVISLAGMSFAVGMVVDNAIVALENIFRHRQMGKNRLNSALDGASEVWGALFASTLTTVAIFLPVLFVEEEAGQLFRDIAIAVSCSVILSLLVAITVIPSLANKILINIKSEKDDLANNLSGLIRNTIANSIMHISKSTSMRLIVICSMIGISAIVTWSILPKSEYLPTGNRNLIFGILLPPPGYNLDQIIEVGQIIEDALKPYWESEKESSKALKVEEPLVDNMFFVAFGRSAFMGASSRDPSQVKSLIPIMQTPVYSSVPGMIAIIQQSSLFQGGGNRAINIEITGPNLRQLIFLGERVFHQVMQEIPNAQARPIPGLDLGNPEIRISPNRLRAANLGLSSQDIGRTINAILDGIPIDGYQYLGEEIDIVVKSDNDWFQTQDIASLSIYTPAGHVVPLSNIADIKFTTGPEQINHIERSRAISISVIPPEGVALESALEDIREKIIKPLEVSGELQPPYAIELTGTADDLKRTREALQWNFILALIITYLLMASLFESFLYPFVILLSVPPALAGGVLGLEIVNTILAYQPLDILTMLGFVILVGVVVNNAILIVHQTLNIIRKDREKNPQLAIRDAVHSRVRPIFMSVITSALGMMPLVVFPGAGSELYRGLGSVVIGGLLLSTLFTLFLVPTFLSLAFDLKSKLVRHSRHAFKSAKTTK